MKLLDGVGMYALKQRFGMKMLISSDEVSVLERRLGFATYLLSLKVYQIMG